MKGRGRGDDDDGDTMPHNFYEEHKKTHKAQRVKATGSKQEVGEKYKIIA